jgi:sec-independent protein translocase protein TatB
MLDLTPVKLLILFIVVMVLAGPDKLPQVARQLGAGWRKVQDYRDRIDQEVRQNIPDLPSSEEIVRFARSPISLLNQLASSGTDDALVEDPASPGHPRVSDDAAWPEDRLDPQAASADIRRTNGGTGSSGADPSAVWLSDDPSMN